MIEFYSETEFELEDREQVANWISLIIRSESKKEGEIEYVFCSDEYLHELNVEFLNHDTFTDIISFDNSLGDVINGEIYISIDRVSENSEKFEESFMDELHRVMIHGVLHFCGYPDKTQLEKSVMREKENWSLEQRNFV